MQKKSSSNLSFLDVLFGALGAVLILFIIDMKMVVSSNSVIHIAKDVKDVCFRFLIEKGRLT